MPADRVTERASDAQHVGIFGGSFNPPHVAHLIIAQLVCEQFALDQILWIPNRQSPFKAEEELAPAADRLEMTKLATQGNQAFLASDLEMRRSGVSYTVETIRTLQQENSTTSYHLIIGSDSLESFSKWRQPDEILERVELIVFRRPGYFNSETITGFESRVRFADAPLLEISSTMIRKRRREGRTIRYMVPEPIHDYILERGLYGA